MIETPFILLGLVCLAVMETIQHHFYTSIFARTESLFWYLFWESDWRNKYVLGVKKTGYAYVKSLIDGYHVSKWLMLASFGIAVFGFNIEPLAIYLIIMVLISIAIYYIQLTKLHKEN